GRAETLSAGHRIQPDTGAPRRAVALGMDGRCVGDASIERPCPHRACAQGPGRCARGRCAVVGGTSASGRREPGRGAEPRRGRWRPLRGRCRPGVRRHVGPYAGQHRREIALRIDDATMGAVNAITQLDDYSAFLRPEPDGGASMDIAVRGAHCANCLGKIEGGVRAIDGVTDARLNLSTGKLHVSWHGQDVAPAAVLHRVRALGYDAAPYDAAQSLEAGHEEGRRLLRCLAIAGFGTVFVMGLTDAVWYGAADMNAATRQLFFWLAAAVSVPVTLFAAQPFFQSALTSRAKHTYFDAAVMLAFLLLIGRYLDYLLRDRARGAAQHLVALQSATARR